MGALRRSASGTYIAHYERYIFHAARYCCAATIRWGWCWVSDAFKTGGAGCLCQKCLFSTGEGKAVGDSRWTSSWLSFPFRYSVHRFSPGLARRLSVAKTAMSPQIFTFSLHRRPPAPGPGIQYQQCLRWVGWLGRLRHSSSFVEYVGCALMYYGKWLKNSTYQQSGLLLASWTADENICALRNWGCGVIALSWIACGCLCWEWRYFGLVLQE